MVPLPRYGTALLRTELPRYQLLRGTLLLVSSTLAFFSLRCMPLAEFTSVVLIAPLVATLLAAVALGNRFFKRHVFAPAGKDTLALGWSTGVFWPGRADAEQRQAHHLA